MTEPRNRVALIGLAAALAAAAFLILLPQREDPAPTTPAVSRAQRAQFAGNLADGPIFTPGLFLDARSAIGTSPSPAGDQLRLVARAADGSFAELRRRPFADIPVFDSFTTDGTTIAWVESSTSQGDDGRVATEIWAADIGTTKARRLTADTGNFVGYGSAYDLVIADGAVHWAAAAAGTTTTATATPGGTPSARETPGAATDVEPVERTEIRSVPLAGGKVTVTVTDGVWALSAWPWLVDGAGDQTGATTLRNPVTSRDVEVRISGAELATCVPAWCRVMVVAAGGLARIDVMRPDGSDRRQIAGPEATAALTDAALLDRFEVLGRPRPDSDLTGTEALVVHDLADGTTTELAADAGTAHARNGVVWWSTGDQDTTVWHTIDLRTA
ncbi:hypothetical protein AB0M54_34120 [Actinoplanes sp. NPDC051470]|uniref:hypothetical protein n=1 Tax=Actinoplanes sp. NPDC051470 TaxID=3157224 RepID=UPI0034189779